MSLLYKNLVLFLAILTISSCKARVLDSNLAANQDVANALNLAAVPLPQKAVLCSQNLMVSFYGLGEVMGRFGTNVTGLKNRANASNLEHKKTAKLYFEKVTSQAKLLRRAIRKYESACLQQEVTEQIKKLGRKPGRVFYVEVLDGPEVGDTTIHTSSYQPSSNSFRPTFDQSWKPSAAGYTPAENEKVEISMPKHVNRIAKFFIQYAANAFQAPIDQTIYFLKGHGTRVFPRKGYPRTKEEMVYVSNSTQSKMAAESAFFFDMHGDAGPSRFSLFRPFWTSGSEGKLQSQPPKNHNDQDVHDPLDDQDVHDPLDDQDVHDPLDDQSVGASDVWGNLDQSVKKSMVFPYHGKSLDYYISPKSSIFRGASGALQLGEGISVTNINVDGIGSLRLPRGATSPSLVVFDTCYGINRFVLTNDTTDRMALDYSDIALEQSQINKNFRYASRNTGVFLFNTNPLKVDVIQYGILSPIQWSALALGLYEIQFKDMYKFSKFPYPTDHILKNPGGSQTILNHNEIARALGYEDVNFNNIKKRLFVSFSQCETPRRNQKDDKNLLPDLWKEDYDYRFHATYNFLPTFKHRFFSESNETTCYNSFIETGAQNSPESLRQDALHTFLKELGELRSKKNLSYFERKRSCDVMLGLLTYQEKYIRREFVTTKRVQYQESCNRMIGSPNFQIRSFPIKYADYIKRVLLDNQANTHIRQILTERSIIRLDAIRLIHVIGNDVTKLSITGTNHSFEIDGIIKDLGELHTHLSDFFDLGKPYKNEVNYDRIKDHHKLLRDMQLDFGDMMLGGDAISPEKETAIFKYLQKLILWFTTHDENQLRTIPDVSQDARNFNSAP